MDAATGTDRWPSLRVDDWTPTRETLHMWTQIVGKVRMVRTPMVNHWWQVTLYVSPRGLTTGAIPHETGVFDIEFDVIDAVLRIRHSDGRQVSVPLTAKPVAQFYDETMSALDDLGSRHASAPAPTRWIRPSGSPRTISTPPMIPTPRACSGGNSCRRTG